MTRLILMVILAIAVWSYFPETRHWVYDKARPAMTPVFRWQAKKEMNEIARGLQTYERENYGRLPSRRQWPDWLEANYFGDASRDAWGGQYLLKEGTDSFRIVSIGPDQVYRTEDDITVARRFARADRRENSPLDATPLLDLLATWGPGLLFALAVLETSFVTGLAVPSGVATSVATVLAGQGVLAYPEVAAAAVAGGWAGDQIGYWIGWRWGRSVVPTRGRLGAAVRRAFREAERFFGRHPLYSVTLARLVPFVRTVMPLGAGASGHLSWPRYLLYEAPGVLAWAAMYMAAGHLAGESWRVASGLLGAGWAGVFVVVGLVLWTAHRRRSRVSSRRRPPGTAAGEG